MGCGSSKSPDEPLLEEFPVYDTEDGYPPPRPPANRKEECFDSRKYTDIDSNAIKAVASPQSTYDSLLGEITRGCTTDLQKLRAVYMWLAVQKIESESYPKIYDNSTPRGYMKNIKHKNGTYTDFFTLLCRAARLPCVIVRGKGKSLDYEVGDQDFTNLNSRWTAVYVDGSWRLVHPLWSFRAVAGFSKGNWILIEDEGQAVNRKESESSGHDVTGLNEFYFLTDPDEFIYICRPDKDPWQLLAQPWSMDKYINIPYCHPLFFQFGLKHDEDLKCILKSQKGKCWIDIMHSENVDPTFKYELFYNENESRRQAPTDKRLDKFVAYNNEVDSKGVVIRFPIEGVFKIVFKGLCEFKLECDEIGETVDEFPNNPEFGYGQGTTAKKKGINSANPTNGFISCERSERKTFSLNVDDPAKVTTTLKSGDNKIDFSDHVTQDISGNRVNIDVMMPDNPDVTDCVLQILVASKPALNYLLSTDKIVNESNEKEDPVRDSLIKATRGTDIDNLQRAINQFESEGLEDKGDLTRANARLQELIEDQNASRTDEALDRRIRDRLKLATEESDIDELEEAINEFIANRLEDRGDLTDAKQRLLDLYTSALQISTAERKLSTLENIVEQAKNSRVCGSLEHSQVMLDAERTLRQLRRLQKYLSGILAMKQTTVSEITSYKRPKQCIHDVMKATYLLLGEKDKALNRWEHIQGLTRRLGKESLIRRIKQFDVINLRLPVANKSDGLLGLYDQMVVRENSAGAGTFYNWSHNMIQEVKDGDS
ncbi:hillarin [Patella vulgata]|uniref:hillarin n=1 Tax=Patella vulgata TaxID=6465 RepID=UPI0024A8B40C|nr:hillarin [Patella vulgata]